MKLALYQGPAISGATEETFACVSTQLTAAAAAGATMLVMPELFLPGYNQPELHDRLSQPRGGDWETRLAGMARAAGCGLTIGWAEREGETVYNAATAFGADGGVLGHYRKIQLFGPMEQASFAPGDAYCTFELGGVKAALLICYDVEFAPHVRALAEQGVSLILVPTANAVGFDHVQRAIVPGRAAELGLTIVYANYCGFEAGLSFGGLSLIADPLGQPMVSAGRGEALLVADLGVNDDLPTPSLSTQLADYREL